MSSQPGENTRCMGLFPFRAERPRNITINGLVTVQPRLRKLRERGLTTHLACRILTKHCKYWIDPASRAHADTASTACRCFPYRRAIATAPAGVIFNVCITSPLNRGAR